MNEDDLIFITNGSMVENSSVGSMKSAPILNKSEGDIWKLWKNLAKKDPEFGNPDVFIKDIDKTKWELFTVTFKGEKFLKMLEEFMGNESGTGGLVTFKNFN
jgi:oleate hydratase